MTECFTESNLSAVTKLLCIGSLSVAIRSNGSIEHFVCLPESISCPIQQSHSHGLHNTTVLKNTLHFRVKFGDIYGK
jgi:hypothetical protein